jgi:hypothetical protein
MAKKSFKTTIFFVFKKVSEEKNGQVAKFRHQKNTDYGDPTTTVLITWALITFLM